MINKYGLESSGFKSGCTGNFRRFSVALAAFGMAGAFAIGAAGCDTAAQISFPTRTFQEIHSAGFTATSGTCGGVTGGEMAARFVLIDNDNMPIVVGDAIDRPSSGSVSVELNADSLSFSDGALMEVTANACEGNADCDSAAGFQCADAPGLQSAPGGENLDTCQIPEDGLATKTGASGVSFVADTTNDQVYGILMENTGGLRGWSLPGTEEAFDANGDGQVGTAGDLPAYRIMYGAGIATDPTNKRSSAITTTYTSWVKAYQLARKTKRKTYFGLWSFNDTEIQPDSHIENVGVDGTVWASESTPITRAISDYQTITNGLNVQSRANVYEAALALLNGPYSDQAMTELGMASPGSVDKILVLFVDGYDDMRENDSADIDDVIVAANENNVRIFVVHVDPAILEPNQIREDPEYWKGQLPCDPSDANACEKNYETCRNPRGYGSGVGTDIVKPDGFEDTYCLPERDENGRVGPIEEYSRLACATQGGYMYTPSIDAVDRNLKWTPHALDGLWEATVTSATLNRRANDLAGKPLKVHTNMGITVAGETRNYAFTQLGGTSSGVEANAKVEAFDNRGVVFVAE